VLFFVPKYRPCLVEITARIQPKMAAYLRHTTRGGTLSPKEVALPEKIAQEHERILQLSNEKVACAERVMHLLTKAMGRLDVDLARAMDRTGEGVSQDMVMGNTGGSRTPMEKLPDTLRSALQGEGNGSIVLPAASAGSSASTPHPPTKRTLEMRVFVVWFCSLWPFIGV
jgi:Inhibitor of growth proteins N-terminal histone-binding